MLSINKLKKTIHEFILKNYLIIIILFLGLIVRLWGITSDLPMVSTVGDELPTVSGSIGMLARLSFIPEAAAGTYFPMIYYINIVAFLPYLLWLFIINGFSILAVKQSVIFDLSGLLLMARLASLIMGLATVGLVYLIGQRIFSRKLPACLAALFFALDPLNVSLSHFARVWGAQTFFIFLSLYFSLRYFGDRNRRILLADYIITAIFILLSIGVNLVGLLAYFLWFIIIVVYRFDFDYKKIFNFLFSRRSMLFHGILFFGGVFILYLGRDSWAIYNQIYLEFFSKNNSISLSGGLLEIYTLWQKITMSFVALWQYQSSCFLLIAPAFYLLYKKDRRLFYFLLASLIIFFMFLNPPLINSARPRYLAIMIPFIILPAAWLSALIIAELKKINIHLSGLFIIAILAPIFLLSLRNDYLLAKSSTNLEAYNWLKENINDEQTLVVGSYLSQDLLPNRKIITQIKEYAPEYYSSRLKYFTDNWSGGYNLYSDVFLCRFPLELIEKIKFRYLAIYGNSTSRINLSEFKICGLIPIDLSKIKPIFYRDTSPFENYSLLNHTLTGDLLGASYKPLLSTNQFGSRIMIYKIN